MTKIDDPYSHIDYLEGQVELKVRRIADLEAELHAWEETEKAKPTLDKTFDEITNENRELRAELAEERARVADLQYRGLVEVLRIAAKHPDKITEIEGEFGDALRELVEAQLATERARLDWFSEHSRKMGFIFPDGLDLRSAIDAARGESSTQLVRGNEPKCPSH